MVYRYRTNLKKVFLTDPELHQLNERIAKSNCQNFSVYARRVLLNPIRLSIEKYRNIKDCA